MDGHTHNANSLLMASDATHVATRSGDWSDSSSWKGGRIPNDDALVYIPKGIAITYDVKNSAELGTVRVDGTLDWTRAHDTEMVVETIVTAPGSQLDLGSQDDPIPARITADVIFRDGEIDGGKDPERLSHGLVAYGEVSVEGAEKESFLALEREAKAGDKTLTVDGDLGNWDVGDTLLIIGTKYVGEDEYGRLQNQDEERRIVAIDGDKITLDRALDHDHTSPAGMNVDTYVGNMSRNVTFSSENPDGLRGHVMLHNSATDGADDPANSVRFAAFEGLGRTDKTQDIDNGNPEGRYPLHLHKTGTDVDASSSLLQGNAVSGAPGWGIVQHSSRAIVADNIVSDVVGGGIVSEVGDETGAWTGNLVTGTSGYDAPNKNGDGDQGAAYENQSRVIVQQDNIAANSKLGWNFSGQEDFAEDDAHGGAPRDGAHRKMFEREQVKIDPSPFDVALDHEEPPIIDFTGNEVIGAQEAFRVYHRQFSDDTDTMSVIRDFTVWGGDNGINLKNYSSNYEFIDSTIQGSGEGFRVERKTSAVVFNNVEFRDFGTGYHSYGINHESVLIDVDFVNVDNHFKLEDLMKNVTDSGTKKALVDYFRTEYGIDYNNPMPEIVDSSKLTEIDRVRFVASNDADLKIGSGDSTMLIKGKIIDSVGERTFNEYVVAKTPSGNTGSKEFDGVNVRLGGKAAGLQIEFTFDEFLAEHGAFEKADGTWVSPVVNWITDRLTGKQHPVIIDIELDDVSEAKLEANRLDAYPDPKLDNADFDYGFNIFGSENDGGHGEHDGQGGSDGQAGHGDGQDEVEGGAGNDQLEPDQGGDAGNGQSSGGEEEQGDEEQVAGDEDANAGGEQVPEAPSVPEVPEVPETPEVPKGQDEIVGDVPAADETADEGDDLALIGSRKEVDVNGSGLVRFTVEGLDDDAWGRVVVWNDDTKVRSDKVDSNGEITLDLGAFEEGVARVRMYIRDDDGNKDKVWSPKISFVDPDGGSDDGLKLLEGSGRLRGSNKDDLIVGGGGSDTMYGGAGDDELRAKGGSNKLYGQDGADTFVFNRASLDGKTDDVKDFDLAEGDVLSFRGFIPNGAEDLSDWVRIEKAGTLGVVKVDETGKGDSFEEIAVIRGGRGLTIEQLEEANAIEIM